MAEKSQGGGRLAEALLPTTLPGGAGPETLRGGSWNNNQRNARVSYRNNDHPDNFNNNIGFRVVCSPDFLLVGKAVALRRKAGQERQHGPVPVACGIAARPHIKNAPAFVVGQRLEAQAGATLTARSQPASRGRCGRGTAGDGG